MAIVEREELVAEYNKQYEKKIEQGKIEAENLSDGALRLRHTKKSRIKRFDVKRWRDNTLIKAERIIIRRPEERLPIDKKAVKMAGGVPGTPARPTLGGFAGTADRRNQSDYGLAAVISGFKPEIFGDEDRRAAAREWQRRREENPTGKRKSWAKRTDRKVHQLLSD